MNKAFRLRYFAQKAAALPVRRWVTARSAKIYYVISSYRHESHPNKTQKNKVQILFTTMEKLMHLCVLTLWSTFGILFTGASTNAEPSSWNVTEMCTSPDCLKIASKILASVNTSADPCEDFYDYACGGWIARNTIPDNETEIGIFKQLRDVMQLRVQSMLANISVPNMYESEVKAKAFYSQCRNRDIIEEEKAAPLLKHMKQVMGDWPVLTGPSWNASNFDLFETLLSMHMYGYQPLFKLEIDQNVRIPTSYIPYLSDPVLFTTRDVMTSKDATRILESQFVLMTNVTSLLMKETYDNRTVVNVLKDLVDIQELTRYFVLAGKTGLEKRDVTTYDNQTTLGSNQNVTFSRSNFLRKMTLYLQELYGKVNITDLITNETLIVVRLAEYFDKMDEKLVELDQKGEEGKRQLANYLGWYIINANLGYLSKEYRDAAEEYTQRVEGRKTKQEKTPEELCAAEIKTGMPMALSAIYVRDFVPADLKATAATMMGDLKSAFRDLLNAATWMDEVTRGKALVKLEEMRQMVGYPDVEKNNVTSIDAEYKELRIGQTYFGTVQGLHRFQTIKELKKLVRVNSRADPFDDAFDITIVNAFNAFAKNDIVILAAILQPPFYSADSPQYINYGGVGCAVGHEITHGFDNTGSKFDDQGVMRNWWTNETRNLFNEKKQGLIDQYSNFTLSTGRVDGRLTQAENIADNGGYKACYRAYFDHYDKRTPEKLRLPGLTQYTKKQVFFVQAAQEWCSAVRPQAESIRLLTATHSPSRFRVNGPLSNMQEFAAAFHCPVGSRMNPETKYGVW